MACTCSGHWRSLSLSLCPLQSAFSFLPASSLLSSPGRGTMGFKFWKERRDILEARRPRNVRGAAALPPVSSFPQFTRCFVSSPTRSILHVQGHPAAVSLSHPVLVLFSMLCHVSKDLLGHMLPAFFCCTNISVEGWKLFCCGKAS